MVAAWLWRASTFLMVSCGATSASATCMGGSGASVTLKLAGTAIAMELLQRHAGGAERRHALVDVHEDAGAHAGRRRVAAQLAERVVLGRHIDDEIPRLCRRRRRLSWCYRGDGSRAFCHCIVSLRRAAADAEHHKLDLGDNEEVNVVRGAHLIHNVC
jgi:hypothetical protein